MIEPKQSTFTKCAACTLNTGHYKLKQHTAHCTQDQAHFNEDMITVKKKKSSEIENVYNQTCISKYRQDSAVNRAHAIPARSLGHCW